jgi:hypothetical protein
MKARPASNMHELANLFALLTSRQIMHALLVLFFFAVETAFFCLPIRSSEKLIDQSD